MSTPLIVADTAWAETLPDWLKNEVEAERTIHGFAAMMGKEVPKVGDAEVVTYLFTAALRAPLTSEFSEIYIYLSAKLKRSQGKELEPFMQEAIDRGLSDWEEHELNELRYKIYTRRGGEVSNNVLDVMREFKKDIDNIPPGMEAQKTLEGSPMQLFFQSNEPKKTSRPLKKNAMQRKEKKGSNNLATFGMQDPDLPTIQECFDILKRAEENRKDCCGRLIKSNSLKEDAWSTGEFDKVCSDCEGCRTDAPVKTLKVKFWDGSEEQAKTREDAVHIAEAGLEARKQEGDRVVWILSPYSGRLPVQAIVINECGEETDACAIITEAE